MVAVGRGKRAAPADTGRVSGAAAFRTQNQIRQNAQDMQDYLTDLGKWEKSIKKKDKQLSRKAAASSAQRPVADIAKNDGPPIRQHCGTVAITSGPPPIKPKAKGGSNGCHNDQLQGDSPTASGSTNNPATNGTLRDSGKTTSHGTNEKSVSAAEHTHDNGYVKWAKFDVDAALREVDGEKNGSEKKPPDNSDSDTDGEEFSPTAAAACRPRRNPATTSHLSLGERLPVSRPAPAPSAGTTAMVQQDLEKKERERGNVMFSKGDFEGAIKCYTRCIGMSSKSAVAFSNRAMAYLKLREFGKAESDCNAALQLDSIHVKSLQRRAVARNALGKHRAALSDLQAAAEIDPTSKQIRKDMSKMLETLKAVVRRAPKHRVKVESEPLPAPKPRTPPGAQSSLVKADRLSSISSLASVFPVDTKMIAVDPSSIPRTTTPTVTPATIRTNGGGVSFEEKRDTVCPGAPSGSGLSNDDGEHVASRTTVKELPDDGRSKSEVVAPLRSPSSQKAEEVSIASSSLARMAADDRQPVDAATARAVKAGATVEQKTPVIPTDSDASATAVSPSASSPRPPQASTNPRVSAVAGSEVATAEPTAGTRAPSAVDRGDVGPAEAASLEVTKKNKSSTDADAPGAETGGKIGAKGENDLLSMAVAVLPARTKQANEVKRTKKRTRSTRLSASTNSASTAAISPDAAAKLLPTTGYQLEHMWRSAATSSDPDARVELLRTLPPSSIVKIFRHTPLEVELLEEILGHLGAALLPRRPATAMRWLKSLSKASRFGMAVSLMGEKGQRSVRELMKQIEASSIKREELEALKKQFSLL